MKDLIKTTKIIIMALIVILGASYVYAWTGPDQAPTDGNTSAPINVGNVSQYKDGALSVGGIFRAYSRAIFDEKVGIGTLVPASKLDVSNGHIALTGSVQMDPNIAGLSNTIYFGEPVEDYYIARVNKGEIFERIQIATSGGTMSLTKDGAVSIGALSPNSNTLPSTGGEQDLRLDVRGAVGASYYCDESGNNCVAATDLGSNGSSVKVASGQDVIGPDAEKNFAIIDLAEHGFNINGSGPHIIVSERNYNRRSVDGNTLDASYCGFEKVSKLEFRVTCWVSTNSGSGIVDSTFDWIAIQN